MGFAKQYVSSVKAAPREILGIFKGKNKIKNIAFALGGAVATYALGGIVNTSLVTPGLNAIPGAGPALSGPMAKRVIGAAVPFTLGFVANKFIKGDLGKALVVGGAIASLAEAISPGLIDGDDYSGGAIRLVSLSAA